MALWEYKVISSGKGGFATPALLESFLNQLGTEEWEIIEFRSQPDNPLAFQGLARRPTQRDWTLEAAAAAAARAEADKLRAEFAAKFQAASGGAQEGTAETDSGNPVRDDSFRRPRDTDHDLDPYALDDSSTEEEEIPEEEQLPTFFEAIRPHMRRNQKGPGYSVGADYLVKKFEMIESDFLGALQECGFPIPEDEDDKPVYIEYDGDIYWLNTNRRGELWINTREKPRQVFRPVKGTQYSPEPQEEKPQHQERRQDRDRHRNQQPPQQPPQESSPASVEPVVGEAVAQAPEEQKKDLVPARASHSPVALPEGTALLDLLRPQMRRSRGGLSGTISFLSRALRQPEADLVAALATIGLVPQASQGEKAPVVEVGDFAYWLNRDGRGGIWINARDARRMRHDSKPAEGNTAEPNTAATDASAPAVTPSVENAGAAESAVVVAITPLDPSAPAPSPELHAIAVAAAISSTDAAAAEAPAPVEAKKTEEAVASANPVLSGVRLLLKEQRTGNFAAEVEALSQQLGKTSEEFLATIVGLGLAVPEKPREKPVFVEHAGEIFWLNRNAKGQLWLNAKPSKFSEGGKEQAPSDAAPKGAKRAPRGRRKSSDE